MSPERWRPPEAGPDERRPHEGYWAPSLARGWVSRGRSPLCWAGADLRRADLFLADLEGADLRGADLTGARLRCARLQRADLTDAILVDVDLCYAHLEGAVFEGADLRGARIWRETLLDAKADFSGALLDGAELHEPWKQAIVGRTVDAVMGVVEYVVGLIAFVLLLYVLFVLIPTFVSGLGR